MVTRSDLLSAHRRRLRDANESRLGIHLRGFRRKSSAKMAVETTENGAHSS